MLLVQEAKANVDRIIETPNKGGVPTKSLGLLKDNIITLRDSKMYRGERYTVRVRKKRTYPEHRGDSIPVGRVGILLEKGTEHRQPMPWMSLAYETKRAEIIPLFVKELNADIGRIVRRLSRKNGVET